MVLVKIRYLSNLKMNRKTEEDPPKPIFIDTPSWSSDAPNAEHTLINLAKAVGHRIVICGGPCKWNNLTSIGIFDELAIAVPSVAEWEGAPSWRSSLMVTGILELNESGFSMHDVSYEWIDS